MLWHRDVIKLLMALNEITCDLVAVELPQWCHSIVSKNSFKQSKWKTFAVLGFSEQNRERKEEVKKKTPRAAESKRN